MAFNLTRMETDSIDGSSCLVITLTTHVSHSEISTLKNIKHSKKIICHVIKL